MVIVIEGGLLDCGVCMAAAYHAGWGHATIVMFVAWPVHFIEDGRRGLVVIFQIFCRIIARHAHIVIDDRRVRFRQTIDLKDLVELDQILASCHRLLQLLLKRMLFYLLHDWIVWFSDGVRVRYHLSRASMLLLLVGKEWDHICVPGSGLIASRCAYNNSSCFTICALTATSGFLNRSWAWPCLRSICDVGSIHLILWILAMNLAV